MRLLIMGAPGAGKGTQATAIAERYGIPAISTGDIFRANIKGQTELGKQVQKIIEAGNFVSDELTEQIVADRLNQDDARDGFLLDGFPRTMHQVDALDSFLMDKGVALDAVICLDVSADILISRLLKRAEIEGRSDDNEQTIRHRQSLYEKDTRPLLDHYEKAGLLVRVDGQGSVEEVDDRIAAALASKVAQR